MLKKSLAAALGAMLMAGTVGAVEVAQGGKGDVLIAPMFMTGAGWTSEIKVINTSRDDSAVAKVVFHGPVQSEEILDFLIFLSPGDVWTGTVVQNADGTVGVSSSDDSSVLSSSDLATKCPTNSAVTAGFDSNVVRFTTPHTTGYATVTQARMLRKGTPTGITNPALGNPFLKNAPVPKYEVLSAYSELCQADALITTADTDNVLTGTVTLANPQNGNKLALPLTALANYDSLSYLKVGELTAFAGPGKDTTKQQVEDALWASEFVVPFDTSAGNLTFATVTFPTKETYNNAQDTQYDTFKRVANVPSSGTVPVVYTLRNEQEEVLSTCRTSPCAGVALPAELNLIEVAPGELATLSTGNKVFTESFTKGWLNIDLTRELSDTRSNVNYNNFGQAGAPALVTYINWDYSQGSTQGTWQYAAKTYAPAAR